MKLYNTLSRKIEQFKPLEDNMVKLYTCGLTVYSQPHIGNWVSYIYWDILVRTLKANGYSVNRVQNITDVGHLTSDEDAGEDKMLKSALQEGTTAWEVAQKYARIAESEAYGKLGLLRPDHMPKATDYIKKQIEFVKILEETGYTYVLADGVYFDTAKLKNYGELARLDIEGLRFGARVADTGKKNPTDFAVWKFSKPNEKRDMEWASPWGTGFPGWHLECSVMARELLGDQIDIHTGGIDHIPVHHTNEIAQTEAITGKQFSQVWLHANHIKVNGQKMSKSLGNIYTLKDIENKNIDLDAFKLMVLSKHYQTEGNFTWKILEAAQNRLKKWRGMADLYWQTDKLLGEASINKTSLLDALNNNLDTPAVLLLIDEHFDNLVSKNQTVTKQSLADITLLLGIDLLGDDIEPDLKDIIRDREAARKAKNWPESDRLKEQLLSKGLELKDTATGTIWLRA